MNVHNQLHLYKNILFLKLYTENKEENISLKTNCSMRGQLWSKEEEDKLVFEYVEQKLTISEIARLHNRNNGGIRARLKKLGLVD